MKKERIPRREGFWYTGKGSLFPMPVENDKPWKGQRKFLAALKRLQSSSKITPPPKGWSNCRICGCKNGSRTYSHNGWEWPSGLAHYIEEHNVRPSLAFQEMVLGETLSEN